MVAAREVALESSISKSTSDKISHQRLNQLSIARTGLARYAKPICAWLLLVSVASMHPLLLKDGLATASAALSAFFLCGCCSTGVIGNGGDDEDRPTRVSRHVSPIPKPTGLSPRSWPDLAFYGCLCLSLIGCVVLCIGPVSGLQVPKKYPDLWAVLISAYSCVHFVVFAMYFNWMQLSGAGAGETVVTPTKKKYQ